MRTRPRPRASTQPARRSGFDGTGPDITLHDEGGPVSSARIVRPQSTGAEYSASDGLERAERAMKRDALMCDPIAFSVSHLPLA